MTFLILFALAMFVVWITGPTYALSDLARDRKYKSGTIWCVWRWSEVDSEYILRLHVVKTPWFAVCLHWIRKPDAEPWLHDHPVSFLSLILRGSYAELRASGDGDIGHKVHRWFNFVRASSKDRHRIIFTRKGTLTLCLMGPKTREWGFHMPEGWVMWKDYYARLRAGENMRQRTYFEATGEPTLVALEREFMTTMTDEHMKRVIGVPDGVSVDEDTRPVDGDFAVSREDFYKNVRIEFGPEDSLPPVTKK